MNMDSGNKYILQAILDNVSKHESLSRDRLQNILIDFGFSEYRINNLLDSLGVHNRICVSDLPKIADGSLNDMTVAITYPACNNRGIPAKNTFSQSTISLLDGIRGTIYEAQQQIVIISPYVADDGLQELYFPLISKLKAGVQVKLISRELDKTNDSRIRDVLKWIKNNLAEYEEFSLYDYHFVSNGGHIDSTFHAKVVVSDDTVAYVGSGDIRRRAFVNNLEMGTIQRGYNAKVISSIINDVVGISKKYEFR